MKRWWRRVWRRPDTDGGEQARALRRQVACNQPRVDHLVAAADRRVSTNHFREVFTEALYPRRDDE